MKTKGTIWWSATHKPDTKYDPCYFVDIVVSKEDAKILRDIGLKVKTNVDPEDDSVFYTFKSKRNEYRYKGYGENKKIVGTNKKPQFVDAGLNPFDGIMGRGTEVFIVHEPWQWNSGKGWSSDLKVVQILNLVPWTPKDVDVDSLENPGVETDGLDELKIEGEGLEGAKAHTRETVGDAPPKAPIAGDDIPF